MAAIGQNALALRVMRALAISVLLLGCTEPDRERGRLVCKGEGKTFEAYVPRGGRAAVTARAEDANLTDCRFDVGPPTIEHWPVVARAALVPVPTRPRPPTTAAPINVPPTALENNRIGGGGGGGGGGTRSILPDDDTQAEIRRSGKTKVVGSYKVCVTIDGEVATVSQLKSTGFSAYDGKIIGELEARRYLPYIYSGDPVPVCTALTFIYSVPD